jgi:tartrate dehydratase beta subunit/fumarate hydratase class I family protein
MVRKNASDRWPVTETSRLSDRFPGAKMQNPSVLLLLCLTVSGVHTLTLAQSRPASSGASPSSTGVRQVAYLKASNVEANDHFGNGGTLEGHGVSLSGDGSTLAVSAPYESSGAKGVNGDQNDNSVYSSGAVYIFVQKNGAWSQQAYIKPSNPGLSYRFGHMVSLSQDGNTLAVSAHFEASATKGINGDQTDKSIPQAGAVYVFTRTGTTWIQQAYIKASNTGEKGAGKQPSKGDQFGFAISLSADGNTLAAGAISEDSNAKGINGDQNDNSAVSSGAVYVYTRSGTAWSQQAYVKASNTDANNLFGYSVGLSADGNTMAVSAYDEGGGSREINGPQDKGRRGSGAIYVFTRTGTNWAQSAYLKASNAEPEDSLGYEIAISQDGNTIAGGAADEDCFTPGINPTGCDNDYKTDTSTGAVYIFVRDGGKWTQQAFIKSSHPNKEDWFGSRLNISGDGNTLAVGAQLENGASKGINGNQADLSAEDSGAIYLFTRSGTTWTQKAYVKASNAEAYDEFGSAMALSRDGQLMAVGARSEASASKGINGDMNDNSAMGAGALYIFSIQ